MVHCLTPTSTPPTFDKSIKVYIYGTRIMSEIKITYGLGVCYVNLTLLKPRRYQGYFN